ncbi:sulfite reductase flavoprotein subunit alpha [Flavobacterium sp. '19STA2R22 D10 B1']|uniref:diflavin oxidoreductase n=1 Tax=Flavobacterium aerium TaxID=3037261 RepID=UPI00278BEF53|nr:flavodoxin domain-containing protein [Flavobacterium sp. '19STA2R22 D10 B1']
MLSDHKLIPFKHLIQDYTREELVWINGYISGYLGQNESKENSIVAAPTVSIKPTIIYGTETGNSKKVASQLQALLKKNKIQAKVFDTLQYPFDKIEKEEFLIIIMSTQGDGELPQNAVGFYEKLAASTFHFKNTKYAVLGLGDTSYPLFCQAGVDIDTQLNKLGALSVVPLEKVDVDYAQAVQSWSNTVVKVLQDGGTVDAIENKKAVTVTPVKKSYKGIVTHKVILNDRGSNKETYHIEITTGEVVHYQPGDALGLYPKNNQQEIESLTQLLAVSGTEWEAHLLHKNIRGLNKKSLQGLAQLFGVAITEEKLDLIEFLKKYSKPDTVTPEQIIVLLNPIAPRLYSIASAVEAHEEQVHLTVNLHKFQSNGLDKIGLCSQFLADFELDREIDFYIHHNQNFKLAEEDAPIIMIGPGTGIAPFRSFLAHRDATGSEGENWLVFGEQHFVTDFYYQTDIQEWLSTGVLTKLDTAFSRDQKEKIYVQDRLKQNAKELNEWIGKGAYVYVCGQKSPMSEEVEQTLIEIIAAENKLSIAEAKERIEALEVAGRYQKDVY